MKIWYRFKNWLIKKLGGWTDAEHAVMSNDLKSESKKSNALAYELDQTKQALAHVSKSHSALSSFHARLAEEYEECRDTLVGLEILKTKIETFQAKGAFPYSGRSGKQLQYRIAEKKTAVVNKLISDILQQNRFFVIEVNEESNKVEVSATISVLEGGVISGKEAQLPQDGAGAGDSRKSGETPQND